MNLRSEIGFAEPMRQAWILKRIVAVVALLAALLAVPFATVAEEGTPERGPQDVILATTTSTQDSGLLDVLVPLFEEQTGYHLKPIAVGSGAALKMGEEGEADVLLVHSPAAEEEFMAGGFGVNRRLVFYNDFVIVGPADDPAGIAGSSSATEAMTKIAAAEATFISRGDDSGTHRLEIGLWEKAAIEPSGDWYVESGTGMGDTLNIANEREAYTITDRGTYLAQGDRLSLSLLVEGDPALLNVYHVIGVNPDIHDRINSAGAEAFIDFLLDPAVQAVIGEFGAEEFGQPLFTPCADNSCGIEATATPTASPVS
jgi:tungstate transport system substrate-binding protein